MKNKFIILILVVLIGLTPLSNTYAQDSPVDTNNVSLLRNLGQFFVTFFDTDSLFRFTLDDIFVRNQCLRRDIFALQSQKTQLSDFLIENYRTITEEQLELQKVLYASYTAELNFLRNIDLLKESNGNFNPTPARISTLRNTVINVSPSNLTTIIDTSFPFWLERYLPKLQEYQNCENSWTAVSTRVARIESKARQLSDQSRQLRDAFTGLGQEIVNTPGAFGRNTVNTLSGSVRTSYQASKDNFTSAINDFRQDLQAKRLNPRQRAAELNFQQSMLIGRNESIGQLLIQNNNLTTLPSTVSQIVESQELRQDLIQSQVLQLQTIEFADTAVLTFLPNLIEINDSLVQTNFILSSNSTGSISLANQINNKQCSA